MQKVPAILLLAATVAVGACANRQRPAPAVPPSETKVEFIREMAPLPGVTEGEVAVTPTVQSVFDTTWPRVSGEVSTLTTPEQLARISGWAPGLTATCTLPEDWIARMPMAPIGTTARGEVVFGQTAEQSPVNLPSQSGVVYRRVIVAAAVDPATRTIPRVYVTIRGWAEE